MRIEPFAVDPVIGLLIGCGLLLLLGLLWEVIRHRRSVQPLASSIAMEHMKYEPRPLLTETEGVLYNLLRFAAQDRYLVLSQVPLGYVIQTRSIVREDRSRLASRLARQRVPFVLIHPGTKMAEIVVVPGEASQDASATPWEKWSAAALGSAGIRVVRVSHVQATTIAGLSAMLGIDDDDAASGADWSSERPHLRSHDQAVTGWRQG